MITIIDYGVGNIRAFINVYKQLNIPAKVARSLEDLDNVSKVILPGVGAFDHAMEKFSNSGMKEKLSDLVFEKKVPVLGICVGMQMLALKSEEGSYPGLGWIDAEVKRFDVSNLNQHTQLPHMGWNNVNPIANNKLFNNITDDCQFYFLHSYYFKSHITSDIIATTEYGGEFVSAINHQNIYGVQFHPEKSHHYGLQLLKNFSSI